jgi:hypothetical protein
MGANYSSARNTRKRYEWCLIARNRADRMDTHTLAQSNHQFRMYDDAGTIFLIWHKQNQTYKYKYGEKYEVCFYVASYTMHNVHRRQIDRCINVITNLPNL